MRCGIANALGVIKANEEQEDLDAFGENNAF